MAMPAVMDLPRQGNIKLSFIKRGCIKLYNTTQTRTYFSRKYTSLYLSLLDSKCLRISLQLNIKLKSKYNIN